MLPPVPDDSTYKHAKDKSDCNSFLLAVLSKYNGSWSP